MDDRDIIAALATVKDPELGRSLVDLGMVRDVHAGHEVVRATLVLTTSACPLRDRIQESRPKPPCAPSRATVASR